MKNNHAILVVIFLTLINSTILHAKQISLKQVASEILQNSNLKKSREYNVTATQEESYRASKYWLPNVYLNHSTYNTNDNAKILIGNLLQRTVTQNDFTPDTMSRTATKTYSKSALGITMPLFQEQAGKAYSQATKHLELATKYDLQQTELLEYANITATYISIVIFENQKTKLLNLRNKVNGFIQRYSIGEKDNPIGYSGLLVLQALQNKIAASLEDTNYNVISLYNVLTNLGFISNEPWQVEPLLPHNYINKYLNYSLSATDPFNVISTQEQVNAVKYQETINRAKNLPKINLFAENYMFTGARATKTGHSIGVNFTWNLFDTATFNLGTIAKNNYTSCKYSWLDQKQKEKTELENLTLQTKFLKGCLALAAKNETLMLKNMAIAEEMFKNGSINAQDLTGSIMKYLDCIVYLLDVELKTTYAYAKKFTKLPVDVNKILSTL